MTTRPIALHRVRRVEEEVDEDLLEVMPVAEDTRRRRNELELHVDTLQHALRLQQLDDRRSNVVDGDGVRGRLARARVVEQAADDAVDSVDLATDLLHRLRRRRVVPGVVAEDVRVGVDGGERVPDLVRHARREPADARQLLAAHE
jgi:hypothetical protein